MISPEYIILSAFAFVMAVLCWVKDYWELRK